MKRTSSGAAVLVGAVLWILACGDVSKSERIPAATSGAARWSSTHERCTRTEQRQFDFWIGEWNVENRQRNPATPEDTTMYHTGTATARVHTILDGCAIIEHWEGYLVPDRHVLGFSLRTFDPESGRWHVLLNWPAPGAPSFFEIDGSFSDGIADFVFERPAGGFARYRFLDTSGDRPRWEGASARNADGPWNPFWVMQFSRRDPVFESALHNGSARTTGHCPDERARTYDFLIGDWIGEETMSGSPAARTRPIEIRSRAILEGCAIVDIIETGERNDQKKEFRVRSFVPSEERWVEYSLDRDTAGFVRWEGGGSGETAAVVRSTGGQPSAEGDLVLERLSWQSTVDGGLVRETTESSDGGESWRTVARAELRPR